MTRKKNPDNPRLKEVMEFVHASLVKRGVSPSHREIMEATNINSTSVVSYYLRRLEEMGLIILEPKISRGIRLPMSPYEDLMDRVVSVLEPFAIAGVDGKTHLVEKSDFKEAAMLYQAIKGTAAVRKSRTVRSISVPASEVVTA